jgi:hypothetical protein
MCNNNHIRKFYDLWKKRDDASLTFRLAFYCAERSGIYCERLCDMVAARDVLGLCTFDIDYSDPLNNIRDLQYARQCLAFFSKDSDLRLKDTERAMYCTFLEAEMKNRQTNKRWSLLYETGNLFHCEDGFVDSVARKISHILGDCPSLLDCDFAFGPGSSTTVRKQTSARHKLDARPTCSAEMVDMIELYRHIDTPAYWEAHANQFDVVPGELSSVPKNALTERSILIEPTLSTPYQKAVGSEMKKRLLVFGCNLYDQRQNQELALLGSITDEIVTVDVRNASNTMALLPVYHSFAYCPEWFSLLEGLRTGEAKYKGKLRKLEMFSSMGNGFTFELESLLFYAIAMTVCERVGADTKLVSVYGDDIIIPTSCYTMLVTALQFFGFELNKSKSYASGPFRESCGADYYLGEQIRPFYKKDRWTDARIVGFLNYDYRNFRLIPEDIRCQLRHTLESDVKVGPDGLGDGHLIVDDLRFEDLTEAKRQIRNRFKPGRQQHDLDGWFITTYAKVPERDMHPLAIGDRLYPLYNIYRKPSLISIEHNYSALATINGNELLWDLTKEILVNPDCICSAYGPVDPDLEDDPYVLRGGWRSKAVRIYMFKGSIPFVG